MSDPRVTEAQRMEALERAAHTILHQGASADAPTMHAGIDRILSELGQIRETQTEIKIQLARSEARFQAIEAWQVRHDAAENERKTDIKALLMPSLGNLLWALIVGGIGYWYAIQRAADEVAKR